MLNVKQLREEFGTLKPEYVGLMEKQVSEKRAYTAEEKTQQEVRFARMEVIKGLLAEDTKVAGLTPTTYESGSVWVSNLQLEALNYDFLQAVLPQAAYNKELGLETAINAVIAADSSITQVVDMVQGAISYAKLVELNRRLPRRYDRVKVMVLDSTTYADAEKLTGADGHPVLNVDPQNGELRRFNGTPVLRTDFAADDTGTDTPQKVVGCIFSLLGFVLRDAGQAAITRYSAIPDRPSQTGFNLFSFHAFDYAASGIATLKN